VRYLKDGLNNQEINSSGKLFKKDKENIFPVFIMNKACSRFWSVVQIGGCDV